MGCAYNFIHPLKGIICYDLSVRPSVSILLSVLVETDLALLEREKHPGLWKKENLVLVGCGNK